MFVYVKGNSTKCFVGTVPMWATSKEELLGLKQQAKALDLKFTVKKMPRKVPHPSRVPSPCIVTRP